MVTIQMGFSGASAFNLQLARFQDNVSDASPVFESLADQQANVWLEQFATEGAYGGERWAPLSPAYGRWKAKRHPGRGILELTGDLADSLTSRPFGVDVIREKSMVIGTADPKAMYHQKGTDNMPARPIITKPTRQDAKQFAKTMQRWIITGRVQ